jgi:hypothetical protein
MSANALKKQMATLVRVAICVQSTYTFGFISLLHILHLPHYRFLLHFRGVHD